VRDDLMFADLLRDIQSEDNNRPWFKTLLTLSSHEPWDVPTKVLDDEVYNAFNYLDNCIGNFIDSLRQLPVWDNLLVVILPDHGYRYLDINEATRLYNHIPLIWTGGAVRQPTRVEAVCNQSDLAATLLGQLQLDHSAFTFSRDVVSKNYVHPVAWHTSTSCVSVFDSLGFTAYDLDAQTFIAHEGEQQERQLQLARALLQLTSHDLIAK
jgi:phosphoglycerol transferase MdoB-like AlkP superfamily enzyme